MANVVLLGTLDTKGKEYAFVRDRLRVLGVETTLIDAGILGEPLATPDISREDVAHTAGATMQALVDAGDRGAAVDAMASGATVVVQQLVDQGKAHGILGLGGSGGSTLVSHVMRELPIGFPKLLVSTVASGDTRPYVGDTDIAMMPSIVDISGINRLSEQILGNAAAAIAGMAQNYANYKPSAGHKPIIGATMFGVTTPCVTEARNRLEQRGYEVLVFHATGVGGDAMETLVRKGIITGVLDITTTELADALVGGVLAAGPERLEVAGRLGIPQVVSVGALDMVNFGPMETVPAKFKERTLHRHNASITLMRTTPAENAELGKTIAEKLNAAMGPVTLFIPTQGVSMIDVEGQPFHDPAADAALYDALRQNIDITKVKVVELDTDINDPAFAEAMVAEMDKLYRAGAAKGAHA